MLIAAALLLFARHPARRLATYAPGDEMGLLADWNFAHYGKGLVYDITHHTKPGELRGKARIVRVRS